MTANSIKHNHKPTATPPSTVIPAAYNHFLPPSDDDDDNDADPTNLMRKYDGRGKNKGKGEHRRRYRDDNDDIEDLRGLYEEPKYYDKNGRDNDDNSNWYDIEEKGQEDFDDDDDDVVNITAVQVFGMTGESFLGK